MTALTVRRAARTGAAVALAAATLAGCGIRATSVPVDTGAAPSRVACAVRDGDPAAKETQSPDAGASDVRISLVCSSRVVDVKRRLELPEGDTAAERLALARTLLGELRRAPSDAEHEAGFTTAVPEGLRVTGPAAGDDASALRLSQQPDRLPSFALAQIVCTYANTDIADTNRQVLLGGPSDDLTKKLQLYECGSALRTTTEAAETAGVDF